MCIYINILTFESRVRKFCRTEELHISLFPVIVLPLPKVSA